MLRLRVKELAEERDFNMSSLSRASDVSFTTIKRYFKNPYSYAMTETLEKIARALNVEVGDLVEHVPDKPEQEDQEKQKDQEDQEEQKNQ